MSRDNKDGQSLEEAGAYFQRAYNGTSEDRESYNYFLHGRSTSGSWLYDWLDAAYSGQGGPDDDRSLFDHPLFFPGLMGLFLLVGGGVRVGIAGVEQWDDWQAEKKQQISAHEAELLTQAIAENTLQVGAKIGNRTVDLRTAPEQWRAAISKTISDGGNITLVVSDQNAHICDIPVNDVQFLRVINGQKPSKEALQKAAEFLDDLGKVSDCTAANIAKIKSHVGIGATQVNAEAKGAYSVHEVNTKGRVDEKTLLPLQQR